MSLKVGVVGMGIGQLHMLSWIGVEGADVTAICETDEAKRTSAANDWGVEAYASIEELIDSGVDVIDICTPPQLHLAHITQCLEADVHVIAEKPLVDSLDSVAKIRVAAEASSARMMPIFQYRFGPGTRKARALVEAGLTGPLFLATSETLWRREPTYYSEAPWRGTWNGERGGSVLSHAIHNHDILAWIGGAPSTLNATVATRVNDIETEDCAVASATTVDGALMSMSATLGATTESSTLRWCFRDVTIESSSSPYDPAADPWTFEFPNSETAERAEEIWAELPDGGSQYTGQFQNFVDCIDSGDEFQVTLADATASLELVTAWYYSARNNVAQSFPIDESHPYWESWMPEDHK